MGIVTLSVSQQVAAAPNRLQGTGAFVSHGGTSTGPNLLTLLTSASSLASILAVPIGLSTLTWSTGVVTATALAPHGYTIGQVYNLTISGAIPVGYNGTYPCTITSTTAFTYVVLTNPGAETSPGSYVASTQTQLQQMSTTFFAQGSSVAVYVLELGPASVTTAVGLLSTWISNNSGIVYSFLIPRGWDANAAFLSLIATFEAPTAKTYFWVTTTPLTYANYTNTMKCVLSWIEAPNLPANEFSAAAPFFWALHYAPSSVNKVPPFAFTFLYGVTPYPLTGNSTNFALWKAAFTNWIGSGSEGGISNAIVLWGTTEDGNPFNYWYSGDYAQINLDLQLANAIINGSNNGQNPLYLDQDGINQLQAVGAGVLSSMVTFGLLLGTVVQSELDGPTFALALENGAFKGQAVINAVPFLAYYTVSPNDYSTGTYNGLSATVTPLRGFESITFFLTLTNFILP